MSIPSVLLLDPMPIFAPGDRVRMWVGALHHVELTGVVIGHSTVGGAPRVLVQWRELDGRPLYDWDERLVPADTIERVEEEELSQ